MPAPCTCPYTTYRKVKPGEIPCLYRKAADLIDGCGWARMALTPTGRMCAGGAINWAAGRHPTDVGTASDPIMRPFAEWLLDTGRTRDCYKAVHSLAVVQHWNDGACAGLSLVDGSVQTRAKVSAALRECADALDAKAKAEDDAVRAAAERVVASVRALAAVKAANAEALREDHDLAR